MKRRSNPKSSNFVSFPPRKKRLSKENAFTVNNATRIELDLDVGYTPGVPELQHQHQQVLDRETTSHRYCDSIEEIMGDIEEAMATSSPLLLDSQPLPLPPALNVPASHSSPLQLLDEPPFLCFSYDQTFGEPSSSCVTPLMTLRPPIFAPLPYYSYLPPMDLNPTRMYF